MQYNPLNPIIVQSDQTVLVEVDNPRYPEVRDGLASFAELVKSPEHFHTYKISPLSLWNAASAGMTSDEMLQVLSEFSKYPVPDNVIREVVEHVSRYGRVKLIKEGEDLILKSEDRALMAQIWHAKEARKFIDRKSSETEFVVIPHTRGHVKQALIHLGFPVEDLAGYKDGARLEIEMKETALSGEPFELREYQRDSVEAFHAGGSESGGHGVIVLPCGAGKTIVGIAAISLLKTHTLILVTNITSARQWKRELLDKTTLTADDIGEFSGEVKEMKPVTLATYNIVTYRKPKTQNFPHFEEFLKQGFGLVLYDEVHLLPAPVFRVTAELQTRKRLGLTATLVREDGREDDVFSLIGPKRYDVPWKDLEHQGWIAAATCTEIRIPFPPEFRMQYAVAGKREKFRFAAESEAKYPVVKELLERHPDDLVLIIGQYINQLELLARMLGYPLITGQTKQGERETLYENFRSGTNKHLIVSKVGNFSVDLPDANVLIQISGTFGSRQEEAQRLGRILRPKSNEMPAHFYTLVTRDSCEQDYSANRQLFLTEQGYSYSIKDVSEILNEETAAAE
ncbi:MAG: DEAD/DEAH box helicase [Planctomycetota bacterium]|nr:DEAD/DEAH box helicase [Planctomycetota bacterium]MDP6503096.1 DEAD/DEAH box helicase [Planctomycetota bacterium]